MMIRKSLQKIPVSQLDVKDDTFRISIKKTNNILASSIAEIGLVNPPLLQKIKNEQFRIVLGFRRVDALMNAISEIAAFVVKGKPTDLALFRFALQAHIIEHPFSAVEVSMAIYKLRTVFKVADAEIVDAYLPLMGFGKNPKILALYGSLISLEPEIQSAIEQDNLSVEIASEMTKAPTQNRLSYLKLTQNLHLGKNRQREFWRLLTDISQIENKSVSEILQDSEFTTIISADKITHNQKAERVKRELWRRRYPRYSALETEFCQILKEMKLPPQMVLRPSAFFEGEDFDVSFMFRTEEEFRDRVETLQRIYADGIVGQVANLTL